MARNAGTAIITNYEGTPPAAQLTQFAGKPDQRSLMNRLLIVAGHAIFDPSKSLNSYFHNLPHSSNVELPPDCNWHGFEPKKFKGGAVRQMVSVVEEHVRSGCGLMANYDWIAFSGGRTRGRLHDDPDGSDYEKQGIKNSEGSGMVDFARRTGCLPASYFAEECASDSFTNILYSILAFHKQTNEWPAMIGVVSMPHKSTRFHLMALGLGYTDERFTFHGVGRIPDLETNAYREIKNMMELIDPDKENVIRDPLLRDPTLFGKKRAERLHPDSNPDVHYGQHSERKEALDLWEAATVGHEAWNHCKQNWPWMRQRTIA